MHVCLFEDDRVDHLLPLAYTRAAYDLRLGIRTLYETTKDAFADVPFVLHARNLVAAVTAQEHDLPVNTLPDGDAVLFVNGRYLAEESPVLDRIRRATRPGEPARVFTQGDEVVAAWVPDPAPELVTADALTHATFASLPEEEVEGARFVRRLWHLIDALREALVRDFHACTHTRNAGDFSSARIDPGVHLLNEADIYLAPGVHLRAGAILNASDGPIYIDQDATIMEGAILRGPLYLGPHAVVKIGGNIEGSAIGPWCKVSGEIHSSVLHSYSNKGHTGFLGHAYIGRWCNLGADTNNSNLRNDYGLVSMYNEATGVFEKTGRQFLGLIMGDHSKCSIDTMFNTGTLVGVSCNLYGAGFHPRYVPSFSWGSPDTRYVTYRLDKALRVAEAVMHRRTIPLTTADRTMLTNAFNASEDTRVAFQGMKM